MKSHQRQNHQKQVTEIKTFSWKFDSSCSVSVSELFTGDTSTVMYKFLCLSTHSLAHPAGEMVKKLSLNLFARNNRKHNFQIYVSLLLQLSRAMRKCALCHMRTTKAQISLRIRAV